MCPASVAMSRMLGYQSSGDAIEGTLAHELAASLLMTPAMRRARLDCGPQAGDLPRIPDEIRAELKAKGFDAEGVEADIQCYVSYVSALPCYEVEKTLDLSRSVADSGAIGTADAISDSGDALVIADLKMGRNPVDPCENKQLTLYAHAVIRADMDRGIYRSDDHPIRLVIIQPRLSGRPNIYETTVGHVRTEVQSWFHAGSRAVQLVEHPEEMAGNDFQAGSWCRYCGAAGFCDTLAKTCLRPVKESVDVTRMDTKALSEAWKMLPMVEAWCKAVSAEVFDRLKSGVGVPGLHLGTGKRGARRWTDPSAAEKWARETFGDKAFGAPELLSVAQLEKACMKEATDEQKEAFAGLVFQPEGSLKVLEGDAEDAPSVCAFPDMTGAIGEPAAVKPEAEAGLTEEEKTETEKKPRKRAKKG